MKKLELSSAKPKTDAELEAEMEVEIIKAKTAAIEAAGWDQREAMAAQLFGCGAPKKSKYDDEAVSK
jgi:hypothetical protein